MATVSAAASGYGRSERGPWDYAVPLNSEEPGNYDVPRYAINTATQSGSHQTMSLNGTVGRPLAPQDTNVNSIRSDANGHQSVQGKNVKLIRKTSNLGVREEADDVSENARVQGRSKTMVNDNKSRKVSGQKPATATPEEEQYWIHRDKLAQIESKELEEAGFRLPIVSRAASRAAYSNYDPMDDAHYIDENAGFDDVYEDDGNLDWELRTPEEVAADYNGGAYGAHVRPTPRAVNSKIPIKKSGTFSSSSPPDRESPRPRSRNTSGQYSGIPEPRNRSRSIASGTRPHTPTLTASASGSGGSGSEKDASPNETKATNKTGYTPRKSSQGARAVSTTKPRVASASKADSPPKRPGTSSGLHHGRPSTSHRPEGEAPWIATMYKPDPRLPPDQQVLPTHARRIAQEQWEKEGKIGTVYDKDFRLLNTTSIDYNPSSLLQEERHKSVDEHHKFMGQQMLLLDTGSNGSPTKTTILMQKPSLHELSGSPRSPSQGPRPGTSGTDHGGYKTMPTIHGPPTPTLSAPQKPVEPMRMQDINDDNDKQNKGCCCIVM